MEERGRRRVANLTSHLLFEEINPNISRMETSHKNPTLSSHVLDTATGFPAKGMNILLERKMNDNEWGKVSDHRLVSIII